MSTETQIEQRDPRHTEGTAPGWCKGLLTLDLVFLSFQAAIVAMFWVHSLMKMQVQLHPFQAIALVTFVGMMVLRFGGNIGLLADRRRAGWLVVWSLVLWLGVFASRYVIHQNLGGWKGHQMRAIGWPTVHPVSIFASKGGALTAGNFIAAGMFLYTIAYIVAVIRTWTHIRRVDSGN